MRTADGSIVGFTLPDGREVGLAICLHVEGGKKDEWIIDERKMARLGFDGLDYGRAEFCFIPDTPGLHAV